VQIKVGVLGKEGILYEFAVGCRSSCFAVVGRRVGVEQCQLICRSLVK
jgi:hypothetical protein